jgi:hypothetical protein
MQQRCNEKSQRMSLPTSGRDRSQCLRAHTKQNPAGVLSRAEVASASPQSSAVQSSLDAGGMLSLETPSTWARLAAQPCGTGTGTRRVTLQAT